MRWEPGTLSPPSLKFQYAQNRVLGSFADLMPLIEAIFNDYDLSSQPPFSPHLFRVDAAQSASCPILRGEAAEVMVLISDHRITDGTSLIRIAALLNQLYGDPDMPCPLASPQRVPVAATLEIHADIAPVDKFCDGDEKELSTIRWDFANPPPFEQRRAGVAAIRIPAGHIRRRSGVPLTDAFAVANILCFLALSFAANPDQTSARTRYSIPALISQASSRPRPAARPEPFFELLGNHIQVSPFLLEAQRDSRAFELVDRVAAVRHAETKERAAARLAFLRENSYANVEFLRERNWPGVICSNVGRVRLPPGPATAYLGCSVGHGVLGNVNVFPHGQPDGSILLFVGGSVSHYSYAFFEQYGHLWAETCSRLADADFAIADMFAWPEFRAVVELLPPATQ